MSTAMTARGSPKGHTFPSATWALIPVLCVLCLFTLQLALRVSGDRAARRSAPTVPTTPAVTPPPEPVCARPATPASAARMVSVGWGGCLSWNVHFQLEWGAFLLTWSICSSDWSIQ